LKHLDNNQSMVYFSDADGHLGRHLEFLQMVFCFI